MADATLITAHELTMHFPVKRSTLTGMLRRGQTPRVVRAVDGIDFSIGRGETLALVGESGCGKSTVAKLVVGLLRASHGRLIVDGEDVTRSPQRSGMQMIFQDPYSSLDPRMRVRDIVAEPILAVAGARRTDAHERVAELLEQVGLRASDGGRYPHQFSGGQRQRISIARALAVVPRVLVCDEPTSSLDVSVQAQILNLMKALQAELGITMLFISHNLAVVRFMAARIGVMYLGRLVEVAPSADLFAAPRHPYTRLLLAAVPVIRSAQGRARRPEPIQGELPSPLAPPSGCAFHPRCPWADERCRVDVPRVIVEGERSVACHAVADGRLAR